MAQGSAGFLDEPAKFSFEIGLPTADCHFRDQRRGALQRDLPPSTGGRREESRARAPRSSQNRPPTWGFGGGPPGTRTPNLRIKSLVRTCRSERCNASDLRVFVSLLPIVSHRFPFLHGDETGTAPCLALSFPRHAVPTEDLGERHRTDLRREVTSQGRCRDGGRSGIRPASTTG